MEKSFRKFSKNYDGVVSPAREISQLLPEIVARMGKKMAFQPLLVIEYWAEVIGPKLAPLTEVVSFDKGALVVKVKSSTLLQLLSQYEKNRLLELFQRKFSKEVIRTIFFRLG